MAWYRRDLNVDSIVEKRWGHVFRIWDRWPEDEAEVRRIVCEYLSGHLFPRISSRRMFPMFNQLQLGEIDFVLDTEDTNHNEATYEPIDDLNSVDTEWMDIP